MTTLKEIYLRNEMSKQAFEACFENEIDSLEELKEYFSINGSFKKFRNCSSKTNNELAFISLEYFDNVEFFNDYVFTINNSNAKDVLIIEDFNLEEVYDFTIVNFLKSLNPLKKESINNFISVCYNSKLCFKTRNALKFYLSNEININGSSTVIFKEKFHQLK